MVSIDRFEGWLSCPRCERDLGALSPGTVACSSGHRFDVGRRGYVGLLREGSRITASRSRGESAGARDLPLTADAIAAMAPRARRTLAVTHDVPTSNLGTVIGCLLSDSPAALTESPAAGVLADLHRRWPIRDGAADAVVALASDPFPIETHRVLAPGGLLVTTAPQGAVSGVIDDLYPWFEHDQSRPVSDGGLTALRLRRRRRPLTW